MPSTLCLSAFGPRRDPVQETKLLLVLGEPTRIAGVFRNVSIAVVGVAQVQEVVRVVVAVHKL